MCTHLPFTCKVWSYSSIYHPLKCCMDRETTSKQSVTGPTLKVTQAMYAFIFYSAESSVQLVHTLENLGSSINL